MFCYWRCSGHRHGHIGSTNAYLQVRDWPLQAGRKVAESELLVGKTPGAT